jgi:sarcosine oxidase, subunit beta
MDGTADVIVVGAGVHGASLAFHLARRGVSVLVLERQAVAGGATGRSSGFVRSHYDLESEALLAWRSFPWFEHWSDMVGAGDPAFVRTGFVQLVPPELAANLRANVAMLQAAGIDTRELAPGELATMLPGLVEDGVGAAAWEPQSGYADPSGTASGFMSAARRHGARLLQGCRVERVTTDGERVSGVTTDQGTFSAPVVVDAAGAWAAELASTVGLDVPVVAWRHDTAYFGLPDGREGRFPIVIDDINGVYFRPEGRSLMLVGLEGANELGGSPDRPFGATAASTLEDMATRLCARVPWMSGGTVRTVHGGQDGMTPDQRAILGRAGPDGFYLLCGFSGTGFKTAPAIGACMAELILDGEASTADISDYSLERFAEGRPLVGRYPYGHLWRS